MKIHEFNNRVTSKHITLTLTGDEIKQISQGLKDAAIGDIKHKPIRDKFEMMQDLMSDGMLKPETISSLNKTYAPDGK